MHARGVRIRGQSVLEARATPGKAPHTVRLEVSALDDTSQALGGAWLDVHSSGFDATNARPCPDGHSAVQAVEGVLRMRTNDRGHACLLLADAPAAGRLDVRFAGDSLHGAAETTASFSADEDSNTRLSLRFDDPPSVVPPEARELTLTATLVDARGQALARSGLELRLLDEQTNTLASALTNSAGSVRFSIGATALGSAGRHSLKAVFDGADRLSGASSTITLTRQLEARLAIEPPNIQVSAGDDVTIGVHVSSDLGPVERGIVEIEADGKSVASATVSSGRALVEFGTNRRQRGTTQLTARFRPDGGPFLPGAPVALELTIAPPGWLSRGWLGLLVAAAAGALFASWQRSRELPPPPKPAQQSLAPGIHIIETSRSRGAFRGVVIDAHDGAPLEGVELLVRRPSLEGDGVVVRLRTEASGRFAFEVAPALGDSFELVARCRSHSTEARPLPRGGTLTVALVTRRRALLDRLVQWHRRSGHGRTTGHEPTPADVRLVHKDRDDVRAWTDALERATFGPDELGPETDAAIRSTEPS